MKGRVSPTDLGELNLADDKPICYILPMASATDWLALEAVCQKYGLPRPHMANNRPPTIDRAITLAVPVGRSRHRSEIQRILSRIQHDETFEAQLLPVSVFWGQNPVQESSLLRILFADTRRPGLFRKMLIILANGRNLLVHFGQPVDYRPIVNENETPGQQVRKLIRVMRVHFRRQRTATLGPNISRRDQLIEAIMASPGVKDEVDRQASQNGESPHEVRDRARRYADEIAADHSGIALGFMRRVLSWLWTRIYDGVNIEHLARLRQAARDNREIVYLPSHRSHMDYLLLSYILHREGLALPQIAAGVNLNFWPVGGLLRRCGAFYLRRSFNGNQLYAAVFRAYVESLIDRGQPMKFYPEGGRSRTGRLLAPKAGLLEMVVSSTLGAHADKPVSVVPVYIGYDRVMEVNGYFAELRGTKVKEGESLGDLIRGSRRALKRRYGNVYVSFGEPIELQSFSDRHQPDWREQAQQLMLESRPQWLHDLTRSLANEVMCRINASATLSATGLGSLILLGEPQRAVAEGEMVYSMGRLAHLACVSPYSPDVNVPETDGRKLLAEAEPKMRLVRAHHPWGDILTVESRQAVLLTYTRNSVMHIFALPSLVANFFTQSASRAFSQVLDDAARLYPLLASEWFLRWSEETSRKALEQAIEGMVECGLLMRDADGLLRRPAVGCRAFATLMSLASIMRESLERYAMTTMLLSQSLEHGPVERERFEQHSQLVAERLALLTGRNSPEFFDARLFQNHLRTLVTMDLLSQQEGYLYSNAPLGALAERALHLLGPAIHQIIVHLTAMPNQQRVTAGQTGQH